MSFLPLVAAVAFYGVSFDPALTNAPSASRIVPVDAGCFKLIQPDGKIRYLTADADRPGVILGERPWLGTIQKNVINVWADPSATGGKRRTAFTFVNGQLRNLFLDGVDYRFPAGVPHADTSLDSLWPERKARTYAKNSEADIWRNSGRLRFWFANPNSAGMLCTQVALLALLVVLVAPSIWKLHGFIWLAIALVALMQAGSRGALCGFILSSALMILVSRHGRLNRKTILALVGGLILMAGAILVSGQAKRLADTVRSVDSGNMRRLAVAAATPQMFADAPGGWQGGEAPTRHAVLNWYVPNDDHVIQTHLLKLAKLGWPAGFGYVFFWVFAIAVGIAMTRRDSASTGSLVLGEWLAFALAGMFNPVYSETSLWVLPTAATAWGLWLSRRGLIGKRLVVCGCVSAGIALVTVGAFLALGKSLTAGRKTTVRAVGKAAVVNGKAPTVWIVEDAPVLGGGGFPGREILAYYAKHPESPALGYVADIDCLPKEVDRLVLPGRAAAEYLKAFREDPDSVCRARSILFLSPSVLPEAMDARLIARSDVQWWMGSFAVCHAQNRETFPRWVRILRGVEQYVPNWMSRVVGGKF